jgi:hypothetical protein
MIGDAWLQGRLTNGRPSDNFSNMNGTAGEARQAYENPESKYLLDTGYWLAGVKSKELAEEHPSVTKTMSCFRNCLPGTEKHSMGGWMKA